MGEARLVVLDRDGVINRDSPDFVRSPADFEPLPGSLAAIARLTEGGFTIVVATNQSGIARGLFTPETLEAIHARMHAAVAAAGGRIAAVFVCPHGPDDGCGCRKPAPGLLHQAAERFGVPLAGVPVIGDSGRDLEAARAAGARPMLVLTGNGERTAGTAAATGVEVFADLAAAADRLLAERRGAQG